MSSELSVTSSDLVDATGNEVLFPLLVPTLTKDEISLLLSGKRSSDAIFRKAIEHARKRISEGLSPFKD